MNECIGSVFLFSHISGSSVAIYHCVEINGQKSIILKFGIILYSITKKS